MSLSPVPTSQVSAFQQLKPVCVNTIQRIIAFQKRQDSGGQVVEALDSLLKVLKQTPDLNTKLAEYVFFPLSHVFRESTRLPHRATDMALQCLSILISRGWDQTTSPKLYKELLTLLSFILSRGENGSEEAFSEEVKLASLDSINNLFSTSPKIIDKLCEESGDEAIAVIGKATHSILETLKSGTNPKVQIAATSAITSLGQCLKERKLFFDFLPGMISVLAHFIQPSAQQRRSFRSTVSAIDSLRIILQLGIQYGDDKLIPTETSNTSPASAERPPSWIKRNWTHIRMALVKVLKAKDHEREEVRQALFLFCISIIRDSKDTRNESSSMLVEALVTLCHSDMAGEDNDRLVDLEGLMLTHGGLLNDLKTLMHAWILRLPRIIRGADEQKQRSYFTQLSTGYVLCKRLNSDTSYLYTMLSEQLFEGAELLVQASQSSVVVAAEEEVALSASASKSMYSTERNNDLFTTSLGRNSTLLTQVQLFLDKLASEDESHNLLDALATYAPPKDDPRVLAYLWLVARLCRPIEDHRLLVSSFLNDEVTSGVGFTSMAPAALENAYSTAVDVLSSSIHSSNDWRVEALSLEIVAIYANRQGDNFEPELVDTLFPVVERMGSSQPELRNTAIACLQRLASNCGAISPASLIVRNADYMVNSIALKFNSFDISFQSPRVLTILIELCGSDLIPYLDDIVDSIISSLASYHGYPVLVNSLFGVLESIIKQGNPNVATKELPSIVSRKPITHSTKVADIPSIASRIKALVERQKLLNLDSEAAIPEPEGADAEEETDQEEPTSVPNEKKPDKVALMQRSIVRLVQHHLTNESPTIRMRLLNLTSLGCRMLFQDEDEFLPLVNDIWPPVIQRLFDPDVNVQVAAMDTITHLLMGAGDFLTTRIQDNWSRIVDLIRSSQLQSQSQELRVGTRARYTQAHRRWDALLGMMEALITTIRMTGAMEDTVFELLSRHSDNRPSLRNALEILNADALWACNEKYREETTHFSEMKTPKLDGFEFKAKEDFVFLN